MAIAHFVRPFNHVSYMLGQKLNLIFGIVMVTILVLGGVGWAIERWRTRGERGRHAALHRVRERNRERSCD